MKMADTVYWEGTTAEKCRIALPEPSVATGRPAKKRFFGAASDHIHKRRSGMIALARESDDGAGSRPEFAFQPERAAMRRTRPSGRRPSTTAIECLVIAMKPPFSGVI